MSFLTYDFSHERLINNGSDTGMWQSKYEVVQVGASATSITKEIQ